jgi:rubredoxin
MSVKGMQTTIMATLLAKAVAEDGLGRRDMSTGVFGPAVSKLIRDIVDGLTVPIDMVLHCPNCGAQHIDAATEAWRNPPHRSHLCHACGHIWRPADVPTNGVAAVKTRGKNDSPIVSRP